MPFANRPTAPVAYQEAWFTDAGSKGSKWYFDGTRWKPVNNQCVLATLDATSAPVANAETIKLQATLPAALWQIGDRLQFIMTVDKSGAVDVGIFRLRIGAAGTTSDTQIYTGNILSAANLLAGNIFDVRLESATTVQQLADSTATLGYLGAISSALPAAVTISNVSNALFASMAILSAGATNTVRLIEARILYVSSAN
jgi:hypothetical protein